MKNLKRLSAAVALTFVLGAVAFAGEIPSGPCAPPAPGEMNAPPCAAAQMTPDASVAPGETSSPPTSNAGDASLVTEVALDLLQSMLSIF